jgi:hypothetical protein
MNKKLLLGLVAVVAIGAYFGFNAKDKQPAKADCKDAGMVEQMVIPQLCGQLVSIDMQLNEDLQKQLCKALNKEAPCELAEEDKPAAFKILDARFIGCQKALFAERGVCTDQVVIPER